MIKAVDVLAQLHELVEFECFLPPPIDEGYLWGLTEFECAMRDGISNMLNQCIFSATDTACTVYVSKRAKWRAFRDMVQAALKMLAPHKAQSGKDHENGGCSKAAAPNYLL